MPELDVVRPVRSAGGGGAGAQGAQRHLAELHLRGGRREPRRQDLLWQVPGAGLINQQQVSLLHPAARSNADKGVAAVGWISPGGSGLICPHGKEEAGRSDRGTAERYERVI